MPFAGHLIDLSHAKGPIAYISRSYMIPGIQHLYALTHNYGLSIILLTLIVKAFLFPLTAKQFVAMRKMQKLQPKLKAIQAEFKDQPEELQKRMMSFYKENNANPLGGCLPMLVQIPILWALYEAFLDKNFNHQTMGAHFLFIQNLSTIGIWNAAAHVLYWDNLALLLIMGVSSYLTQRLMTTNPQDPMQKQMLILMPISMTVMFAFIAVPSGVLLYWTSSNLLTVLQNWFLLKRIPADPVAIAAQGPDRLSETPKLKEPPPGPVIDADVTSNPVRRKGRKAR